MDNDQSPSGTVQDPDTHQYFSYTMSCKSVTGGWSCKVVFDDGQKQFGPIGTVYFDHLSLAPNLVALAALDTFKKGR